MRYVVSFNLIKSNIDDLVFTLFDTRMRGLFGGDYDNIELNRLRNIRYVVCAVFCTVNAIRDYSPDNKSLILKHICDVLITNFTHSDSDGSVDYVEPINGYLLQERLTLEELAEELYNEFDKSFVYHEADCSIAYAELQELIFSEFEEQDLYLATRSEKYRFCISLGVKANLCGYLVVLV